MQNHSYHCAKFLRSAAYLHQLPADTGMEIAFAGRSNAGKSSTLNTLAGFKQLARTSKTPGRTQLINLFTIDEQRRLIDLPGYGYAKVPLAVKKRWQATLTQYLQQRQCLQGLMLIMDIRHPLKEYDQNMIAWAQQSQVKLHILLNKVDKLSRNVAKTHFLHVQKALSTANVSVQLFSATTRYGLEEAHAKLDEWFDFNTPVPVEVCKNSDEL